MFFQDKLTLKVLYQQNNFISFNKKLLFVYILWEKYTKIYGPQNLFMNVSLFLKKYGRRITYIKNSTSTMITADKYVDFIIYGDKNANSMFNIENFKYSLN